MTPAETRCSGTKLVLYLLVAIVMAALVWQTATRAFDKRLVRFTFGDDTPFIVDHRKLLWDLAFVACYGLLFLFCGLLFRALVISGFGKLLAQAILAAVALTVVADLVEDGFVWFAHTDTWLQDAAGTAATVKWSTALVAALSVPAAIVVLIRLGWSNLEFARRTTDPDTRTPWWESVIAEADWPSFSPEDVDVVRREQGSWAKAYRVPGTNDVLERNARRGEPTTAICLSGGGVRSACVAMGATQAFAKAGHRENLNLLDNVDYIISVSGGGYTAGARLLATQPEDQPPTLPPAPDIGEDGDDTVAPAGATLPYVPIKLSERYSEGSLEFDYFRRHSSYIADSPSGLLRALAVVLKNLLASLVALFWVPVAVGFAAGLFYVWQPVAAYVPTPAGAVKGGHKHPLSELGNGAAWWAVLVFVALAVVLQSLVLLVEWWRADDVWERRRERLTRLAGCAALFAVITFAITVVVPGLMRLCYAWFLNLGTPGTVGGIAGVIGLQYLASVAAMVWKKKSAVAAGGGISQWIKRLPRTVFQFIMVVLTLTVLAALWLIIFGTVAAYVFKSTVKSLGPVLTSVPHWGAWVTVVIVIALMLGLADVTSLSLHPFYRGRLARTFAVRRQPISPDRWKAERYGDKEPTWLDAYGTLKTSVTRGVPRTDTTAPKFVFAAAVPISGDEKPAPGLNAVSFVLTADYVGGPELGWLKTPELIRVAPPRVRRDLTVQAAVAVSGAAFASSMGRQSSWVSTLLAVSGARLGTWLPNPFFVRMLANAMNDEIPAGRVGRAVAGEISSAKTATLRADLESATSAAAVRADDPTSTGDTIKVWPKGLPTLRAGGYFYRELFGLHKKGGRLVQVTDGGHYENLGLVEALRRRCQLIYCVDSSGDTPPLVTGLADAIRLAEYELGVTIKVRDRITDEHTLASLAPGSGAPFAAPDGFASLNARVTRQAVLVADITYPEAAGLDAGRRRGVLVVAKAVLWRDCPPWLLTYAAAKENAIFPHDPTSDQWFNEGQFSAYTELGRLIGTSAVEVGAREYATLVTGSAELRAVRNGSATEKV
ncbi:hypothetical protein BH09ACT7_BH09ACT7_15620 [soil metagenome]